MQEHGHGKEPEENEQRNAQAQSREAEKAKCVQPVNQGFGFRVAGFEKLKLNARAALLPAPQFARASLASACPPSVRDRPSP